MNNDLISREYVMRSIANQYSEHNELVPSWLHIGNMREADNAPTVENKETDALLDMLRPKSRWREYEGVTTCERCGFECLYNEEGLYSLGRYCHHCGADMTGGAGS